MACARLRFGAHDRAARDGDMRPRDVGVDITTPNNANVLSTQNWYSAWNTPILNDIHNTLQIMCIVYFKGIPNLNGFGIVK